MNADARALGARVAEIFARTRKPVPVAEAIRAEEEALLSGLPGISADASAGLLAAHRVVAGVRVEKLARILISRKLARRVRVGSDDCLLPRAGLVAHDLDRLGLSRRALDQAITSGFLTAAELRAAPDEDLLRWRGCGRAGLEEIRRAVGRGARCGGPLPVSLDAAREAPAESRATCAARAECERTRTPAVLCWVSADGVVRIPRRVQEVLGLAGGGGVVFFEKDRRIEIMSNEVFADRFEANLEGGSAPACARRCG